jgi:hypothetical protein
LIHLPWRKEDLDDLVKKERDVRGRREERREKENFANLEREKELEMRYFWVKTI